jgi:hypothetical protein
MKSSVVSKSGTCPFDFLIGMKLKDALIGGFPKEFKVEDCPPCYHCKWGPKQPGGTITVTLSNFSFSFTWGKNWECSVVVNAKIVLTFTGKSGECVKD